MYISTNIIRPYMCDPLGLYILLVNKSIDLITSYWSNFINYAYQHIYYLIKGRFNPIDRLSLMDIMWPISQSHFHVFRLFSLK